MSDRNDLERVAEATGLSSTTEPASSLGAARFDPSRIPPAAKTVIDPDDIAWTMEWTPRERWPDKPATEQVFEKAAALALLLLNEVVFLNDHWWMAEWPDEAKAETSINVLCNDVFAWGCADAEPMRYSDIEDLYRHWLKDPTWGAAVWCIKRRKRMPQSPVEKRIREAGIWDLDACLRDSDGSPQGGNAEGGAVHDSADPKGIAR